MTNESNKEPQLAAFGCERKKFLKNDCDRYVTRGFLSFKDCESIAKLEREYEYMQQSFLALTSHLARIQFRLRQIMEAAPWQRNSLLCELEKVAFRSANEAKPDEMPTVYRDFYSIDQIRNKQTRIMNRLRKQAMRLLESIELWPNESDYGYDKGCYKSQDYVIVEGIRKQRIPEKDLQSIMQGNIRGCFQ